MESLRHDRKLRKLLIKYLLIGVLTLSRAEQLTGWMLRVCVGFIVAPISLEHIIDLIIPALWEWWWFFSGLYFPTWRVFLVITLHITQASLLPDSFYSAFCECLSLSYTLQDCNHPPTVVSGGGGRCLWKEVQFPKHLVNTKHSRALPSVTSCCAALHG